MSILSSLVAWAFEIIVTIAITLDVQFYPGIQTPDIEANSIAKHKNPEIKACPDFSISGLNQSRYQNSPDSEALVLYYPIPGVKNYGY